MVYEKVSVTTCPPASAHGIFLQRAGCSTLVPGETKKKSASQLSPLPRLYLSIFSPAQPGPLAWARPAPGLPMNVGGNLEARENFFWSEPDPKCWF
jgi:hypothetical protein